jgi:hypothetical protein
VNQIFLITKLLGGLEPPPSSQLIPAPANGLYADIFFGIIGIAVLIWAIVSTIRTKNILPLLLVIGAGLVALDEPMIDVLGKIIYPLNYTNKFVSFGRDLPLWLIPPYMGFLGITPYYVAKLIQQKPVNKKALYLFSALPLIGIFLLDFAVAKTGHYQYYGEGLFHNGAGYFLTAAYPLIAGYALFLSSSLKGVGAKIVQFFLPSVAFSAAFAVTSFPLCFALNTELPAIFDIIIRLISVLQTFGVVWFLVQTIMRGDRKTAINS